MEQLLNKIRSKKFSFARMHPAMNLDQEVVRMCDIEEIFSIPIEPLVMPKIAEIDFGINELENIKDYLDDNDIYFVNQRIAELEKKKSNFSE